MSAPTRRNPCGHENNRGKAKSSLGWAAFDHKQKLKHQTFDTDSEPYPLLSGPIPIPIFPNKSQTLLEKPYSSVLVPSMCFPSLNVMQHGELLTNEPVTNSCSDVASVEEDYQKLNYLHPWADQNLIQDILAGVNNNTEEALSLLEAMLISDNMEDSVSKPPVETEPEWEEDDVYLVYRKDAIKKIRSASRHSKAANDAFLRGDRSNAHVLSVKAREEWRNAEKLNAKAAAEILSVKNGKNDLWTLDLHGLHAREAVLALQERLREVESVLVSSLDNKESKMLVSESLQSRSRVKMDRQRRLLQAITGKGNHSRGEASLPTAIRSFLSENGYHFDETKAGVVMIRPKFRGL